MTITEKEQNVGNQLMANLIDAIKEGNRERSVSLAKQVDTVLLHTLVDQETAANILDLPESQLQLLVSDYNNNIDPYSPTGKLQSTVDSQSRFKLSELTEYRHQST